MGVSLAEPAQRYGSMQSTEGERVAGLSCLMHPLLPCRSEPALGIAPTYALWCDDHCPYCTTAAAVPLRKLSIRFAVVLVAVVHWTCAPPVPGKAEIMMKVIGSSWKPTWVPVQTHLRLAPQCLTQQVMRHM